MNIKKEKLIIVGVALLAIIIAVIAFILMDNDGNKKVALEDKMNEVGVKFYEEKYYPALPDKQKLADYKDTGVNVSVTNVEVLVPLDDETKKLLNDKECNLDKSIITIYPKAPYGEKDYSLKVELSCNK